MHKCKGRPWSCNMDFMSPIMPQFFLSASPFNCGLWGVVNSHKMPSFVYKFLNSFDMYSPPLFLPRAFTFLLISFSTSALNYKNLENVSSFFHMKNIQHFREKSLIKMIKKFVSGNGGCQERSTYIIVDPFQDCMCFVFSIMECGFCTSPRYILCIHLATQVLLLLGQWLFVA